MPIEHTGTVYYTLNEVAEQVGRSRISIWRWRKAEKIPRGRRYRDRELLFTREEVEAVYAHAHRLTPDEAATALKQQLKLAL